MGNFDEDSLSLHRKSRGKLAVVSKVPLNNRADLSKAYTPGVAAVSLAIFQDPALLYELTPKGNSVAVVSDGSAVLGLGNMGAAAAYPVMEGKALLFKAFAGIDAYPIVLNTQNTEEIVETVCHLAEGFGGINLEDIAAPRCFEVESRLQERLKIPVFHDDQHGTAIVVLAGLMNALKATSRGKDVRIVISGAGAAGIAVAQLLHAYGFNRLILVDSLGALYKGRTEHMNSAKEEIALHTNLEGLQGSLGDVMTGADVFIGVSKAGLVNGEMVRQMARDPIVIAMANPDPEISEEEAKKAGAAVTATGRSDSLNQLNNVLVFPGIFRGALDGRIQRFTQAMFLAAAKALAELVPHPTREKIIPSPFEEGVASTIAQAISSSAQKPVS